MNISNATTNSECVELTVLEALTMIQELSKAVERTMKFPNHSGTFSTSAVYENPGRTASAGKVTFIVSKE